MNRTINGAASRAPRALSSALVRRLPFELTNLGKVMFPEKGYTQGDVLHFYADVARRLLPHLRNRPITLERLPDVVRKIAKELDAERLVLSFVFFG
jgi:hypothetical protein